MDKRWAALIAVTLSVFATSTSAHDRSHLPRIFDHSYFGFEPGYMKINYSDRYLLANFPASRIHSSSIFYHFYAGHYFNPYFGIEAGGYWNSASPVDGKVAALALFAKPTLPIGRFLSVNALLGGGYISRHGYVVQNTTIISKATVADAFAGAGVTIAISRLFGIDLNFLYGFARASQHMPSFYNIGVGVHYNFSTSKEPSEYSPYYFPLNRIELGFYNNGLSKMYINKSVPLFWKGQLRVRKGYLAMYERNFYHTQKYFSLDWGISSGAWTSRILSNDFYTASLFLDFNFWFLRSQYVDLYLTYSIAGPSYISRTVLDNNFIGGHFTFQDSIGIGALLGRQKHVDVRFKIGHFSNGNTLPTNPGIDIPFIFSIGYAFG